MEDTKRITLSLSRTLRAFIDTEVERIGHQSASEYLCDLVRQARHKKGVTMARDARNPGEDTETSDEYWDRKRRTFIDQLLRQADARENRHTPKTEPGESSNGEAVPA